MSRIFGNHTVGPELARAQVQVAWRLGADHIDIATAAGIVVARHRKTPDGAGVLVRDARALGALENHVLGLFDSGRPHRRKERIPPGDAARAAAAVLRDQQPASGRSRRWAAPATRSRPSSSR
jgi:hypothetical protein